jgi:four helix bundle protein
MLGIHDTMIEVIRGLRPLVAKIQVHDRGLATQLREAASSVTLNIAEGGGVRAGSRRERYSTALGSARETGSCLDTAMAWGYVEAVDPDLLDRLDKVRATLWKVVR